MTLEEAIAHAEDMGTTNCFCDKERKCAEEHIQLAEWLRELRTLRIRTELSEEIIEEVSDYQCDRSDDNEGESCYEIEDDEGYLLWDDPDDWCPFCRAKLWVGDIEYHEEEGDAS